MDTRMKYVTALEASRMLNIDDASVRRLAIQGKLKGHKWANAWMIELESVMKYRKYRISHNKGRPKS